MRTKKGESFDLHESFVCAGGSSNGGDTCEGDGGGPLVCPAKGSGGDRYIQVIDKFIIIHSRKIRLSQACQTGGPIACQMRPAAILFNPKFNFEF